MKNIDRIKLWVEKIAPKLTEKELGEFNTIMKMYKQKPHYTRAGVFTLGEVMPFLVDPDVVTFLRKEGVKSSDPLFIKSTQKSYLGNFVKMHSTRYQTFRKSLTCVCCGLKASFFALEKTGDQQRYHFNLYGYNSMGQEVLFTQDHINPKSKGGTSDLQNLQTMCTHCNQKKGNGDE